MDCAKCGALIGSDAQYCSRCGAPVPALSSPQAQPVQAQPTPVTLGVSPPPSRTSALALASLVFGALAWMTLPVVGAVAAVVIGHLAKSEIDRSGKQLGGREFATVGLILGYVQLGLVFFAAIILISVLILGIRLSGTSL
jgi:Domain of unknown function (DUF4190)/zinc-ribbon domain